MTDNGHLNQQAATGVNLTQYQPFANKLGKLQLKYDILIENRNIVSANKANFLAQNEGAIGRLTISFLGCLAALVFDFIVNSATLHWMPELFGVNIPVSVFAIIFLILDATAAILQSGVFAKDEWGRQKAKKTWRIVLWSLAFLKASLFIIFTYIVKTGTFEGTGLMTAVQIGLLILVYFILDFAGEGLYFMGVKAKFAFLENIWYEEPKKLSLKIKGLLLEVKNKYLGGNSSDFNNFLSMFNIKHIYKNHGDNDKSVNSDYTSSFTGNKNNNTYPIQNSNQNNSVTNNAINN